MIPSNALPFTGGLVSRALQRLGVDDRTLVRLRFAAILILPAIAWLPLLALSAVDGKLVPGSVQKPFLIDLGAHIRLLVALPLFILAARVSEVRILPVVRQFLARGIVPRESIDTFEAAVTSAFRLGDSIVADVCIIVLIYFIDTLVVWHNLIASDASTWYGGTAQSSPLSPGGVYYAYIGLPIFQFVLLRWYFRLFIWARFLRRVSKLKLHLLPTHPDRVGGLGFLVMGTQAFTFFAMAHGALLAGWLSTRVIIEKTPLPSFKDEILVVLIFVLCITLAPLFTFARSLARAKRGGIVQYGELAAKYVTEFHEKWIAGKSSNREPLVGSADIQSLADMGGAYDIVQNMRSVPVTTQMILSFAVATLIPVVPFLLTMMPLSEILKKLKGILL